MLQTAKIEIEEQYLQVLEKETASNILKQPVEHLTADQIIGNVLFKKITPFHYKARIRFSFWISEKYRSEFIMIKGLIEFHRSKNFIFNYDLKERMVEADIHESQLNDLQLFLSNVFIWLRNERQFRLALKIALEFENRYKLERESVYRIMRNATVAAGNDCQS